MMAVLLTAIALLGVALLVFWIDPLAVLSMLERLTPNVIYRVRTSRPLAALSFDDSPHPTFTLEVLEILARHDANGRCATRKWFRESKLPATKSETITS
jgi:peptidoglycan/xylan/chitin deacetylase (PgdA/CDA1 family)